MFRCTLVPVLSTHFETFAAENETSWSLDPSIASQMTELQKQTLQRLRNDRISAGGGYRHSLVSEHK